MPPGYKICCQNLDKYNCLYSLQVNLLIQLVRNEYKTKHSTGRLAAYVKTCGKHYNSWLNFSFSLGVKNNTVYTISFLVS